VGTRRRKLEIETTGFPGMSKHPLYLVWYNMLRRCYDKQNSYYRGYGGRGIRVCPQWFDFGTFLRDMGEKPGPDYELDRKDNNGNYEPENVRWATPSQNRRNRRPYGKSKYRGVCYLGKYIYARLYLSTECKFLGYFPTEEEAALAFNKAAIEYFGEDCGMLNEVPEK